jgi:hypothetical protein
VSTAREFLIYLYGKYIYHSQILYLATKPSFLSIAMP